MRALLALASTAVLLAACGQSAPETPREAPVAPGAAPSIPAPTDREAIVDGDASPVDEAPTTPSPVSGSGEQGGSADWHQVVNAADASLLGRLDQAWRLGRAEAEDRGFADEVEALGPLVDPMAGQAGRLQPPPGTYRCRTIKMGTMSEGQGPAYVAYPGFRCSIELTPGGDLILTKTTGSQRTRGLLYPDTDRRLVFVGAQAWGEEASYPRYGQQTERDQVGVFERIGADRWRLVIPWPKQESKLDILELTR